MGPILLGSGIRSFGIVPTPYDDPGVALMAYALGMIFVFAVLVKIIVIDG